jgi:hypothetical protein
MGAVPGSDYVLGGPVFWIATGLLMIAGVLAAFIVFDSLRRAFFPGAHQAEPLRLFYLVPQALYLVVVVLGQVRAIPVLVTGIFVLLTPLALAQGIAYLLLVVFPKPVDAAGESAPDEEFELLADGGDTAEPESTPPHGG